MKHTRSLGRAVATDVAKVAAPHAHPANHDAQAASGDVNPHARHEMIAVAAYHLAERRGFIDGFELDDWLRAEAEIDASLQA